MIELRNTYVFVKTQFLAILWMCFVSCCVTTSFSTHFVMIDERRSEWRWRANGMGRKRLFVNSNSMQLICFHVAIYRAFCRGCFRRFIFIFVFFRELFSSPSASSHSHSSNSSLLLFHNISKRVRKRSKIKKNSLSHTRVLPHNALYIHMA